VPRAAAESTGMPANLPATPEAWTERLCACALPVQRATRKSIELCRAQPERVDANMLADIVLRDPLMCLRVLVNVARKLAGRLSTQSETVTAALVLIGIEPFFRDFADLPVVEEQLAQRPAALAGAQAAVQRAHCAARLAAAFAIHLQDEDVELLHQAALLEDFATLLLWCEAPEWALQIAARQHDDPTLRSADIQREILGVELPLLGHRLMDRWGLPLSLRQLGQGARRGALTVKLAVQIARHLQTNWHNAALTDDFAQLGLLLHVPPHAAAALVREVVT
jgi:HD-like signal output (HDOD) protein